MAHITVCCDHKNEIMHTTFGSFQFDVNGECKMDPDAARQVLAKYKPTMWAKKSGKRELVAPVVEKSVGNGAAKTDEDNFGFGQNVHVSKAARKALESGEIAPEQIMDDRQKVLSVTTPPSTNLEDDLVKSGAAVIPASMKSSKVPEPTRKDKHFSKSVKVSGKRGK
jgi:hypothetical protein